MSMDREEAATRRGRTKPPSPPPPPPRPPAKKKWLPHIKKALGFLCINEKILRNGIYTVPSRLETSVVHQDPLSPHIVSIGHVHCAQPGLLAMHEQKLFYLLFLLHRTKNPSLIFDNCCVQISNSYRFQVYSENAGFDSSTIDKLIGIMLVDGCFILELFLRISNPDLRDEKDPIFNNSWVIPTLLHDLSLLKNQIPFFVLEILIEHFPTVSRRLPNRFHSLGSNNPIRLVSKKNNPIRLDPECLSTIAHHFFSPFLKNIHHPTTGDTLKYFSGDRLHFLDMLHQPYLLPISHHDDVVAIDETTHPYHSHRNIYKTRIWDLNYGTQGLLAAGVKIEKASNTHLLHIAFEEDTLKMAQLEVNANTWSVLKNLVVLEQCSIDRRHDVTSYAVLLKNLIRSRRDVELLKQRGILEIRLDGGCDGVLEFVKCLTSGVVVREFIYEKVFNKVNEHRDPWWRWRKRKASWKLGWHNSIKVLKNDYFSNRWRFVQFAAAVVLLILTALQTVYTLLSYYP